MRGVLVSEQLKVVFLLVMGNVWFIAFSEGPFLC